MARPQKVNIDCSLPMMAWYQIFQSYHGAKEYVLCLRFTLNPEFWPLQRLGMHGRIDVLSQSLEVAASHSPHQSCDHKHTAGRVLCCLTRMESSLDSWETFWTCNTFNLGWASLVSLHCKMKNICSCMMFTRKLSTKVPILPFSHGNCTRMKAGTKNDF